MLAQFWRDMARGGNRLRNPVALRAKVVAYFALPYWLAGWLPGWAALGAFQLIAVTRGLVFPFWHAEELFWYLAAALKDHGSMRRDTWTPESGLFLISI